MEFEHVKASKFPAYSGQPPMCSDLDVIDNIFGSVSEKQMCIRDSCNIIYYQIIITPAKYQILFSIVLIDLKIVKLTTF